MKRFLALLLALALSACAGAKTMRPSPDGTSTQDGLTVFYKQKPGAVFDAALKALAVLDLRIVELDPAESYILAEHGASLRSYGENVGIFLTPSQGGTQVKVTSRKKMAADLFPKDFSQPVHTKLGALLGGTTK